MINPAPILRVALDVPLPRAFDYLAPTGASVPMPGVRVRVPFGRHRLVGIVLEEAIATELEPARLKTVLEVLDPEPVLDAQSLALLRWAADYYHHPIGEVLATALPRGLRTGARLREVPEIWGVTPAGRAAVGSGEPRRAPRQRELLQVLAETGSAPAAELGRVQPGWRTALKPLLGRGWVERVVPQAGGAGPRAPEPILREPGPPLREEQRAAVERIAGAAGFAAFVLQGITGSGKTEVYLQLIERTLARGARALVLVPEIGLTPQLVSRFERRFAVDLAVLHSGLTDAERLAAWRTAHEGRARIVIGTRSAVFAPVPGLGLIVADEEHDASFKQHEGGFRYSARDLAVVRAQRTGIPIVLGSATPGLETLHNVAAERYTCVQLRERAGGAMPPALSLIDLRTHGTHEGLSTPAVAAIRQHLDAGGQVLVFLNRRGYAPTLLCTACGWIAPCRDCDARLTVHLASGRLRCHHCGADAPLPERCPQCGFAVKAVGQGTERIEARLCELFPQVPIARLDRDVARRRGDVESVVARMASGAARLLVGTQMVTKGHDFPDLTLVVVLNADQGLFSADFRAPERLAQTIVQVAGRAGRASRPGTVLIQTEFPDHPLLQSLLAQGYEGFARAALRERAQAAWPPFSRLAALRDSAADAASALAFLTEARALAGRNPPGVRLLGPVPAAMARRAGRHHAQLLVESPERTALHRFLDAWVPQLAGLPAARRVRWVLDVDPIEVF